MLACKTALPNLCARGGPCDDDRKPRFTTSGAEDCRACSRTGYGGDRHPIGSRKADTGGVGDLKQGFNPWKDRGAYSVNRAEVWLSTYRADLESRPTSCAERCTVEHRSATSGDGAESSREGTRWFSTTDDVRCPEIPSRSKNTDGPCIA